MVRHSFFFALFLLSVAAQAHAMSIIIQFEGEIRRVDDVALNIDAGSIAVGQSMTGRIRYNLNAIDQQPTDDETGEYLFLGPPESMAFSFGGDDVRTNTFRIITSSRVCGDTPEFNCSPAEQFDNFVIATARGTLTSLFGWVPLDMSFGLTSQFTQSILTDDLPRDLDLDNWEHSYWSLSGPGKDPSSGPPGTKINGIVTSLRILTVPEPTTLALMGLGLAGIGYARRRSKKTHRYYSKAYNKPCYGSPWQDLLMLGESPQSLMNCRSLGQCRPTLSCRIRP